MFYNLVLNNPSGFREFISWIFDIESSKITQEEVINFFKEKSVEYWLNLSYKQIKEIDYKGKKIISLATISTWENPNDIKLQSQSGFREFISWIFDIESSKITQEEVINFFKEKSAEYWLRLNTKQIYEIEYKGKKITNLSTLSLWTNPNDLVLATPSGFREFISWVFDIELSEITQEEVVNFFKEKSAEYWLRLNQKQIKDIEYKGKKIINLAKLSGWTNPNDVKLNISSGFREFISWIFDIKLSKITQEEVVNFFKEKSAEYWLRLNQKQIKDIEYKGKKIINLAKLSGWTNPNDVDLNSPGGFREFISWVFDR